MKLKGIVYEDFTNYKDPSMFLIFPHCDFKCCIEAGNNICQNMSIVKDPDIEVDAEDLIERYLSNPITKAIVCGGLEPINSFDELVNFINILRWDYDCKDPVVIYTGYTADEIVDKTFVLSKFANIIIKFGRFIPNQEPHYDPVLGIQLASPNQYAVEL